MNQLNAQQLEKIAHAYQHLSDVLLEYTEDKSVENLKRSVVFELSAAVGVLRTLLAREEINKKL